MDVVKEVAPGHPALSPLGEILPFCRELPGADYLSEDPHEETQHTLSVEQWLAYVSGQRTGVRLLVRAMFHKQLEAFDADAERQITLLVVPFQKRWGLWDYYEHCGGTRMRDIDSEQGAWDGYCNDYKDFPEDYPACVPWKTFREFPPVYVNFNPERRCVLHAIAESGDRRMQWSPWRDAHLYEPAADQLPSAPHQSKLDKVWFHDTRPYWPESVRALLRKPGNGYVFDGEGRGRGGIGIG